MYQDLKKHIGFSTSAYHSGSRRSMNESIISDVTDDATGDSAGTLKFRKILTEMNVKVNKMKQSINADRKSNGKKGKGAGKVLHELR